MRPLAQCLLDAELIRLQAIARSWDVVLPTNRRQDVAARLAEAMVQPRLIAGAWRALEDDQRQALEALMAAGAQMPLRVFSRCWGDIRTMGPGRIEREQPWRAPASPAEALWYAGFIFRVFEQGEAGAYEVVFVPQELRPHLPIPPAPPVDVTLEPASEPADISAAQDAALDDICTLLAYLQNERVRPQPGDGWPTRHLARLARQMRTPAPDRLEFLRHLARQLGWLRVTDSGHARPEPGPVADWLRAPSYEQRKALAEAWHQSSTWNDLRHVPGIQCEDTGAWHNDPGLARDAVLQRLANLAPTTWYAIEDFAAAVKSTDPDFQRPGGDYTTWYIRDRASGAYLAGFESWDAVEGALIRHIITAPLAWLGLTDTGAATSDGPTALFRITEPGAAFLGPAEPPPEREPGPLRMRDDFTVHVPPVRRYDRFQLARIADWAVTAAESSASYVYRLTPASLTRARRQGIPTARILEFMSRATDAPVPRYVEAALTRWEARGTEATLERALLLRLSSEELMTQIMASPRTRRLIHEQVGPTVALVRRQDLRALVAALGGLALLPDIGPPEEEEC